MLKHYHLFVEHVVPKDNDHVGTIYEVIFPLEEDLESINSFGGLKPYLDYHWMKIPLRKQWEMVGRFPLNGTLHILALKGQGKCT